MKANFKKMIYNYVKRIVDIIVAILGLIILIPIIIGVYILKILMKDKGPLFYTHIRIGKNGRHFKLYKFRTMVVGADEILEKYLKENEKARVEFEKNQKLKNDLRITRLGKILRKINIDEFPQFINVLKGDMSFIGPRPIVDREVPKFGKNMSIIHSIRPGITGYWVANRENSTTYEQRVEMEKYYVENCSFKLDMQIILKTIKIFLKKK